MKIGKYDWVLSAILGAVVISIWAGVVALLDVPEYILPSPAAIIARLIRQAPFIFDQAKYTLLALIIGYASGVAFGFILALLITGSSVLRRAIFPFLIAQQTVPVIVLAPLFIIWFGFGMAPQILIIVLICFFPVAVNTSKGMLQVDRSIINLMHSYGASRFQIFTKVRLPAAMPFFFTGLKLAATLSIIGVIMSEWSGAEAGLGKSLLAASSQLQTDLVFAIILVLIGMGLSLFGLVSLCEKFLLPWSTHSED